MRRPLDEEQRNFYLCIAGTVALFVVFFGACLFLVGKLLDFVD